MEEKKKQSEKQWRMIGVIKNVMLIYGLIDFTFQIIVQLPLFNKQPEVFSNLGLRKIWQVDPSLEGKEDETVFSYSTYVNGYNEGSASSHRTLTFNSLNYGL